MSKAQRTSEVILEFTFHCEYTYEFGKTVNFHVSETSALVWFPAVIFGTLWMTEE